MAKTRYYVISDAGKSKPYALARVGDDGIPERYIPGGEGWVDWPFYATYLAGGEAGASEVPSAEADRLIASDSLDKVGAGTVQALRGKA